MATAPDAAPRRTVTDMPLVVASGEPVPGANPQTYIRKAASADGSAEAGTYDRMRAQANVGLTPQNVDMDK
jgi:hypothetical protein